jgi:beta-glucanase (GH16 family)
MKIFISLAICGQLLLVAFGYNEKPIKKQKFKLVWSDEFNTDGRPDSTSWAYDLGNGMDGWGNHEAQYYTNSVDNVYVKNGSLFIQARKKDGAWTSARLKTHGKKSWTYGKFVFRAKLPKGKGTWPALWMLGENISTVGWPACGEIDVMEHVGRNPAVVQSALHTPASHGETINKQSKTVATFNEEFHTYEAVWTKEKIEFLIDGESYYTYSPSVKDGNTWPYDSPFFLLVNIAIGGGFGGEVDPALDFAQMEVDYIRVYADLQTKL